MSDNPTKEELEVRERVYKRMPAHEADAMRKLFKIIEDMQK
jgi:hypothetical protein